MMSKTKLMEIIQDDHIGAGHWHRSLYELEEAASYFQQLAGRLKVCAAAARPSIGKERRTGDGE